MNLRLAQESMDLDEARHHVIPDPHVILNGLALTSFHEKAEALNRYPKEGTLTANCTLPGRDRDYHCHLHQRRNVRIVYLRSKSVRQRLWHTAKYGAPYLAVPLVKPN